MTPSLSSYTYTYTHTHTYIHTQKTRTHTFVLWSDERGNVRENDSVLWGRREGRGLKDTAKPPCLRISNTHTEKRIHPYTVSPSLSSHFLFFSLSIPKLIFLLSYGLVLQQLQDILYVCTCVWESQKSNTNYPFLPLLPLSPSFSPHYPPTWRVFIQLWVDDNAFHSSHPKRKVIQTELRYIQICVCIWREREKECVRVEKRKRTLFFPLSFPHPMCRE